MVTTVSTPPRTCSSDDDAFSVQQTGQSAKEIEDENENNQKEEESSVHVSPSSSYDPNTTTTTNSKAETKQQASQTLTLQESAATFLGVSLFLNEFRLQEKLTKIPKVFYQKTPRNDVLLSLLSSHLMRPFKPSLIVGTHPVMNSISGYAKVGPKNKNRIREILTMASDGARVALDWEFPYSVSQSDSNYNEEQRRAVKGPHNVPVVVLLHGINNSAEFGYIRSMMDSCIKRGWIALGMNMRGCGGVHLATPRGYNGAYTGDLRSVVNSIVHRMVDADTPIFIAGYSLGANLITKYLGEEGLAGTLAPNVKGAISLGNPLKINSNNLKAPWNWLLAAGVKTGVLLKHRRAFQQMKCKSFQEKINSALMASTLGALDDHASPTMIRNEKHYPFSTCVGFDNGQHYWDDSSSCHYIQHVSVPMLMLMSKDDFLVSHVAEQWLPHCVEMNPNVMFVESETGGHLGWHVVDGNNPFGSNPFGRGANWADACCCKFIESVILMRRHGYYDDESPSTHVHGNNSSQGKVSTDFPTKTRSRL